MVAVLLRPLEGLERREACLASGELLLKSARIKRAEYEHRNGMREDFDKAKVQGMTFAKWEEIYLERYAKQKRTAADDGRHIRTLSAFFGHLLLSQLTKEKVEMFKQIRKERKTFKGTLVRNAFCNRELACLRHMFRLAVEEGLIETAPIVRLHKENGARDRALSAEEYQRLLDVAPLHLRQIIVCGYETGMRAGEIKKLTWDKVNFKTGFIRLPAEDTKTNEKRAIPLSLTLQETLEEIRKQPREGKVTPTRWACLYLGRQSNELGVEASIQYGMPECCARGFSFS